MEGGLLKATLLELERRTASSSGSTCAGGCACTSLVLSGSVSPLSVLCVRTAANYHDPTIDQSPQARQRLQAYTICAHVDLLCWSWRATTIKQRLCIPHTTERRSVSPHFSERLLVKPVILLGRKGECFCYLLSNYLNLSTTTKFRAICTLVLNV